MDLECSKPQFSKLGPAAKMALEVDSSNFFHLESTNIDEKLYDDIIHMIWIFKRSNDIIFLIIDAKSKFLKTPMEKISNTPKENQVFWEAPKRNEGIFFPSIENIE